MIETSSNATERLIAGKTGKQTRRFRRDSILGRPDGLAAYNGGIDDGSDVRSRSVTGVTLVGVGVGRRLFLVPERGGQ